MSRKKSPVGSAQAQSAHDFQQIHDSPPPDRTLAWLLLAHGAGAPMTSPFLEKMASLLVDRGIGVTRFEFSYMAMRRIDAKRRPPPKADKLVDEFRSAMAALSSLAAARNIPLLIGGKSMGGRVATMAADALFAEQKIHGAVVLGYPFHPPGKPENPRIAHLQSMAAPLLIIQGERDPFGSRAEAEAYRLPPAIRFVWAVDGDHDLGPRGGKGTTRAANLSAAADAIAEFARTTVSKK